MKLALNAWKAVEDYRKYVAMVRNSRAQSDEYCDEMLSLERFALWFEQEFPTYCEAKKS